MREHGADRVDGDTQVREDGGVGVPEAVEGDVPGDSGGLKPLRKGAAQLPFGDTTEDKAFAGFPEKLVGFFADGKEEVGFGLDGADSDAVATVRVLLDILPGEGHDITDTEAGEAAEEGGPFGCLVLTGGLVEGADFFKGEELFADLYGFHLIQVHVEVLGEKLIPVRLFEDGTEAAPIIGLGILGKDLVSGVLALGRLEIDHELLAKVYRHFAESAFSVAEILKMQVSPFVAAGAGLRNLLKVGQEIHLQAPTVNEPVLFIDDGDFPQSPDGLGLLELFGIGFPLQRSLGILDQVDSQILSPAHFHCPGVPDGRIKVQVQGNLPTWQFPFSECYFGC